MEKKPIKSSAALDGFKHFTLPHLAGRTALCSQNSDRSCYFLLVNFSPGAEQ